MSWINEYIYLIEKYAVKETDLLQCENITTSKRLYIICYHIFNGEKYPFIQFMLEKNIVTNQLCLPFIEINSKSHNIDKLIIGKIALNLENSLQNIWALKNVSYKGLINDSFERIYALVDISNIDIRHIHYVETNLKQQPSHNLFVLPSEIINIGSVYNIDIDDDVKNLFSDLPELGVLHNSHKKNPYPIPDAIYSGSFLENVVYSSFFGPSKKYINNIGKKCYYFNTQFSDAFLEGGWANDMFYTPYDVIDKNSKFKKYLKGGITRYALFPESFFTVELENEPIVITEEIVDNLDLYKQVYIVQRVDNIQTTKVVLLISDYNSFVPLSYCEINMKSLGEKYDINKVHTYNLL